ncbi:MAG: hypothetical protein ACRDKJ_04330, partial [Actinomycetota bacterium]
MRRVILGIVVGALVATTTPLAAQEPADRLRIAIVVPIASKALFTPDGRPARDAADRLTSLAESVTPLTRPELADIPVSIAPSPLLCDEVSRFGGPVAARLTGILRDLAARLPVLSAPYASVRLPHLGTPDAVASEITAGREMLESCVRQRPAEILLPPDLVLDRDSLRGASGAGTSATLGPAENLPAGATQFDDVTIVPAHLVPVGDAPNDALVPLVTEDEAALVVDPLRPDLEIFLTALANDPRVALHELQDLPLEPAARFVGFPATDEPPASYLSAVRSAQRALELFRSYTLRDNRLAAVLATAVGRARSSSEWDENWSVGVQRARAVT